jgi:hypothetical protein
MRSRSSTGGRPWRRLRGSALRGGAVSGVVLLLIGCSSTPSQPLRSSSLTRVNEQLAAMPHVASATVTIETTTDGTTKYHSLVVVVSAPDLGASRDGVADLMNRVSPLAWSVVGDRPVLRLRTSPQLPIGPIAEAADWDDVGFPTRLRCGRPLTRRPSLLRSWMSNSDHGRRARRRARDRPTAPYRRGSTVDAVKLERRLGLGCAGRRRRGNSHVPPRGQSGRARAHGCRSRARPRRVRLRRRTVAAGCS